MNKIFDYILYLVILFGLLAVVYYCFNSLGYLPKIKIIIPFYILTLYSLFIISIWNVYYSFYECKRFPENASFLERKMWGGGTLFTLFSLLIVSNFMVYPHIAFIVLYAYMTNVISGIVLFIVSVSFMVLLSGFIRKMVPTPILAFIGVFLSPMLLILLFYFTINTLV